MTILLFGATGQVAREIRRQADVAPGRAAEGVAPGRAAEGVALGREAEVVALGREAADLSDPPACAAAIAAHRPAAVINAAAYTDVDRAESEEAAARVINGEAPGAMARACADLGIPFVHISTDYVFDGAGDAPFAPGHPTAPLGAYGRTKLLGEEAVRAAGGVHAIFRTSWVVSAHGRNFVKAMLRLGAERDRLTIVADQVGGPTPARDIAGACLAAARQLAADPAKAGTYHVSGAPDVSWADFAREIMARAGLAAEVVDVPTAEYPTPAKRPANSRLDNRTTQAVFGLPRPDWREGLRDILQELGALRP